MSYSPPNTDAKVTGSISVADTGSTTASGYSNQNVVTGTPTAGSFLLLQIQTASSVTFALSGNLAGTLVFERSVDGVQWAQFGCFPANTPNTTTTVVSTGTTTGQGDFHGLLASHGFARIRCTAYTSGTVGANIQASPSTGTVSVNSPIRIMDPTGTTANVKAASTAPAATDNALVTVESPNSQLVTNTGRIPVQGAAATTASTPVNIASDQLPTLATSANQTNGNQQVQGNVASGATDAGNPLKTGGVFNSTLPTLTTGQRGATQLDPSGKALVTGGVSGAAMTSVFPSGVKDGSGNIQQAVQAPQAVNTGGGGLPAAGIVGNYNSTLPSTTSGNFGPIQMDGNGRLYVSGATATGVAAPTNAHLMGANNIEQGNLASLSTIRANFGDGFGAASQSLLTLNTVWNGSALDRIRSVQGANTTGTGTVATGIVPSANALALASFQNTAVSTTAVVVKSGASRLHRITIQNPNTATAWLQIFDATSITLGTTVPKMSIPILASGIFEDYYAISDTFATGITIAATTTATGSAANATALFVSFGYI